jgi:GMP synthase (glutamine-hydrolysing)
VISLIINNNTIRLANLRRMEKSRKLLRKVKNVKPILVFQHVPHEMLGTIGGAIENAGMEYRYVELYASIPRRLDLDQTAGLIVLGGPMNVDQCDEYPFLDPEVAWIREAVSKKLPVLGVCLGGQLLAKALGAKVAPNGVKEIGWYEADLTPEAAGDPLFAGSGDKIRVFQWHGDTFALPGGAVRLAGSRLCAQQAFRYGDSAYGLQFHLEMTAAMIEEWLSEAVNSRELASLSYIDPDEIRRQTPEYLPQMQAIGAKLFGRFAEMCVRRP